MRLAYARSTSAEERADLVAKHRLLEAAAAHAHADVRSAIAEGRLRGPALRAHFAAFDRESREQAVEEILGVAFPPLEEVVLGGELISYTPSGWDEILHAFDASELGPSDRFVDIGAGTGKVVLLATLLTGASACGLECQRSLVDVAEAAASALRVDARVTHGDARTSAIPDADVVFMYLPFTGRVLASVVDRLVESRARRFCMGTIERPELEPIGDARSWLRVYVRK